MIDFFLERFRKMLEILYEKIMIQLFVLLYRPAGWDNLNKISILYENMHSCKAEDYYTDVIAPPPQRKV